MSVISIASLKAAPGATTSALLLATTWPSPDRLALLEVDPDGGVLAPRLGLGTDPGLVSLCAAARREGFMPSLWDHAQPAPGGLDVIVGPASAHQARAALELATALPMVLENADGVVVADCGRVSPNSPARSVFESADLSILVTRPRLDELHHLAPNTSPPLRGATPASADALLLVGDGPYARDEVEEALGIEVIGVLPDDPAAAGALRDGRGHRRGLERSELVRAARALSADISTRLASPPLADGPAEERAS